MFQQSISRVQGSIQPTNKWTEAEIEWLKSNNTKGMDYLIQHLGKSYSAVQYLIVKALQEPNLMISIVRKSFPSLRISALRDFKEIMNGLGMWFEESWRASENTYYFHNGSMIEFLSVVY